MYLLTWYSSFTFILVDEEWEEHGIHVFAICVDVNIDDTEELSTRPPSLENRLSVLKEIASEKNIVLQNEEESSAATEV